MNLFIFFLKKKNVNFFLKKINKKYLKIFKNNINKNYKIIYKKYFIIKKKKNNFQKKNQIYNLINYVLLNNFIIKKFLIKGFFFLKKIDKKIKINFLYLKKINFYLNKVKLKKFIIFFEKFTFIKNNLLILKNKINIFKKKITQKINLNDFNTIKYLFLIKNKINEKIIHNNIEIVKKNIKKHKKKFFFNDLFQECYLEFKKIINNNLLSKKNLLNFCYWKMKKIMIRIINSNKKKKNQELVSLDKPLFNHTRKYFLTEKEKSFLIEFARTALKNIIRSLILNLPKKEQKIIRLRFGIGELRNYTLEEIGRLCNLTRERIRQLELNIIIKIRQPEILKILKPFIKILKSLE